LAAAMPKTPRPDVPVLLLDRSVVEHAKARSGSPYGKHERNTAAPLQPLYDVSMRSETPTHALAALTMTASGRFGGGAQLHSSPTRHFTVAVTALGTSAAIRITRWNHDKHTCEGLNATSYEPSHNGISARRVLPPTAYCDCRPRLLRASFLR
jgi:hypothetical protein